MIRPVVFFTSFVFLLMFGIGDADARRFGGGGSQKVLVKMGMRNSKVFVWM